MNTTALLIGIPLGIISSIIPFIFLYFTSRNEIKRSRKRRDELLESTMKEIREFRKGL